LRIPLIVITEPGIVLIVITPSERSDDSRL
jgi:hypothetical protein